MNMIKKSILFSLFAFSSSLLASTDLNSIAGKIYEKLKEDDVISLRQECLSFDYDKENSDSVFFLPEKTTQIKFVVVTVMFLENYLI